MTYFAAPLLGTGHPCASGKEETGIFPGRDMRENTNRQEQPEAEARRWIARMASAEMTAAELAAFREWRDADPAHNRAFEGQRALWRAAGARPAAVAQPMARHPRRRWHPRKRGRIARPAAAIAASLLAAVVFGPDLMLTARADHRAGIAVEHVSLPDGSRAKLDAGAAIAIFYSAGERRIELLRGDVWFEVAHGDERPFRVAALGGVAQDIGTAFEVKRDDAAVTVGVTEGVVAVHAPLGGSLHLQEAERAQYRRDGTLTRLAPVPADTIAAWRQGEILLDGATAREAVRAIGRYRHAPVYLLGDADGARISGVFRTDRPDEAIDAVARMAGLSVHRLGGMILLRPNT